MNNADSPSQIQRYESKAKEYLADQEKTADLLDRAKQKATGNRKILPLWDDLLTTFRLIKSYIKGEYTEVPWKTIVSLTAAIIYFIVPFDLIPDFIIGLGYLDDAAVLGFALGAARQTLEQFVAWERGGESTNDDESV